MSKEFYAIETKPITVTVGTRCLICDDVIALGYLQEAYPRICYECKKRLKKLLYKESEDE